MVAGSGDVFVGRRDEPAHDDVKRLAAAMLNGTFVSLPGLDHWTRLASADNALLPIKAFLNSVAGQQHGTI